MANGLRRASTRDVPVVTGTYLQRSTSNSVGPNVDTAIENVNAPNEISDPLAGSSNLRAAPPPVPKERLADRLLRQFRERKAATSSAATEPSMGGGCDEGRPAGGG